MEIDIIKKTQTEAVQEMKNLEIWAGIIGKLNQQNTRNGKENLSCLKFNRRNVCIGKKNIKSQISWNKASKISGTLEKDQDQN